MKELLSFRAVNVTFIFPFYVPAALVVTHWGKLEELASVMNRNQPPCGESPWMPYYEVPNEHLRFPVNIEPTVCTISTGDSALFNNLRCALAAEIEILRNGGGSCLVDLSVVGEHGRPMCGKEALQICLMEENKVHFDLSQPLRLYEGIDSFANGSIDDLAKSLQDTFRQAVLGGIARSEDSRDYAGATFYEHGCLTPYVFTSAQLANGSPARHLTFENGWSDNHSAIASLLIRTYAPPGKDDDGIDPAYEGISTLWRNSRKDAFGNLYPFPHLYANVHVRSCLAVQSASYSNDKFRTYASEYIKMLRDTVAVEYVRWYSLVHLGYRLDRHLEENAQRIHGGLFRNETNGKDTQILEDWLRDLIELRTEVVLSFRDPNSYARSAGSVSQLIKKMRELFHLSLTEESIRVKLEAVDRMYADLLELHRIESIKRL